MRARGVAEAARERPVGDQPRDVVAEAGGARRQQPGPAGQDDVAGAAGVHRRDRHAERRRLRAARGSATPGPCDGNTSTDAAASQPSACSRGSQPVRRHVASGLARPALDRRPIGAVADDHERPAKRRALDGGQQVPGALVRRELADVEGERRAAAPARAPSAAARMAATSTGLGSMTRRRGIEAGGPRLAGRCAIVELTAITRSARASARCLRARFARM